ncbi:MAG: lysophospholipid acyltransferase family protein [Candidatus Puniceispirillaceae bacterium]
MTKPIQSETTSSQDPIFSFANAELGPLSNACIRAIERLTGQRLIKRIYLDYVDENRPDEYFWRDALKRLKINLVVKKNTDIQIPKTGRLLIIANHPFGVIDGVALCAMVSEVRSDYRILTHRVLRQAPAVMDNILPIDFDEDEKALRNNLQTRKDAVSHLKNGGAVIIFPAGAISLSPRIVDKAVDAEWKKFVAKMANVPDTTIMPFYFEGKNSLLFQLARRISQTLGYSLMFREIKRRMNTTLPVIMRKPLSSNDLAHLEDRTEMTDYLRCATYGVKNDH